MVISIDLEKTKSDKFKFSNHFLKILSLLVWVPSEVDPHNY